METAGSNSLEYAYADGMKPWKYDYILEVLRALMCSIPKGAKVLDLGCGNGAVTAELAVSGWELHGIDSSRSGIEAARTTYPHISFHLADVTAGLPFTSNSFDVILSVETIE